MPSRSSIMFLVPDAEPIVGHLRAAHDPAMFAGIGAHITLMFPFVPAPGVDATVVAAVEAHFAKQAHGPIELVFDRVDRFPEVAYLALENPAPTIGVIRALAARWPEYPLYEGKFPEAVPHLTIAHGQADVLDAVAREVSLELPLRTTITHASLFVESDAGKWHEHARVAL